MPVLDDDLDEGSETLTLTLSNPSPLHMSVADPTGDRDDLQHRQDADGVDRAVRAHGRGAGAGCGGHPAAGGAPARHRVDARRPTDRQSGSGCRIENRERLGFGRGRGPVGPVGSRARPAGRFVLLAHQGNPDARNRLPVGTRAPLPASTAARAACRSPGANPWGTNLLWEWVRTDADAASLTLAGRSTAALSFEAPSLAADATVAFTVTGTGRGTAASRSRDAEVTIDATASATGVAITSLPVEGDTYRRDETIELTVSFTERVFVNGTPELGFRIGSGNGGSAAGRRPMTGARARRSWCSSTRWRQADLDNDGVTVDAGGLTLRDNRLSTLGCRGNDDLAGCASGHAFERPAPRPVEAGDNGEARWMARSFA